MSDDGSEIQVSQLSRILKWVGTIGGSVVGIGALAFASGFLSQRAQYDFAQVPFVFIDYWAYAEIGLTTFVRSIYLFIEKPWALLLICVTSVGLVLLLESRRFRKFAMRPHLAVLGYLALLTLLTLIIYQQLAIRRLRNEAFAGAAVLHEIDTVPAVWPFSTFVPDRLQAPPPASIAFRGTSYEIWRRIADELKQSVGQGARYLEIRPRQPWAAVRAGGGEPAGGHLLGVSVPQEALDSARATALYQAVLSMFALALWGFLIAGAWQKRIYDGLNSLHAPPPGPTARERLRSLMFRLKEEMWFSTHWILRPLSLLLLVTAGVFLLPECYGVLAMPRLGQEYVEVVSERQTGNAGAAGEQPAPPPPEKLDANAELATVFDLLNRYSRSDPEARRSTREEWQRTIDRLQGVGTQDAAKVLEVMAYSSAATAPELADLAQDALTVVSARTLATREGYILYYPRSETDYLRILQPNPLSQRKRWTIYPIKMSSIVELRVKRDEQTSRFIELLQGMEQLDPQEREAALIEAEQLGHPRLLEAAIGGTFDPSYRIRGVSITDVGRYAAALPEGRDTSLRRQVATRRLLEIIRDRGERAEERGGAATSLAKVVSAGDREVCRRLAELVQPGEALNDPYWEVRGSLMTTIGQLRCRNALRPLLALIANPEVPEYLRATIPTQLIRVGTQADSAPTLARLIVDPQSPAMIVGPALTTLALLKGDDATLAVKALCRFLRRRDYGPDLNHGNLLTRYRLTAIDSLRQLGHASSLESLHWLAQRANEKDDAVRARAVKALGDLSSPASEKLLLSIFEDRDEIELVRLQCLTSLERLSDDHTILRLAELYRAQSPLIQQATLAVLRSRADRGSGLAGAEARRLVGIGTLDLEKQPVGDSVEKVALKPPQDESVSPSPTAPRPARTDLDAKPLVVGGAAVTDAVAPGSQLVLYRLELAEPGSYVIEAEASETSDPVLLLFSRENADRPLAADDDGGGGHSAKIVQQLAAGEYMVGVGDVAHQGGAIRISARKE